MDSIIQKYIYFILQQLSSFLYSSAKRGFDMIGKIINHTLFLHISHWVLIVFWVIVSILITKRIIRFVIKDDTLSFHVWWKKNKHAIVQIGAIFLIASFPHQILQFTFQFWDTLISETEVLHELRTSVEKLDTGNLSSLMIMSASSLSAFVVMISQVLEVLSLSLLLLFSPIILVGSLFKQPLFPHFTKMLAEGIISPIMQTVLMDICFRSVLPFTLSAFSTSPLFQSILILTLIAFSFTESKRFTKFLFNPEHNQVTTTLP